MHRYAGDGKIEMYSVGTLRETERRCNLRYIGGPTAPAYHRFPWTPKGTRFDDETIIRSFDSPFRGKADTWFEFDLRIVGKKISLNIDGVRMFDVEDSGNRGGKEFAWTPIEGGGFIGLRNFRPNAVCLDYLRVYRKDKSGADRSVGAGR